jgi:hypothetical protein
MSCGVEGHLAGDLRLSGQVVTGAETGLVIAVRLWVRELAVTSQRDWQAGSCRRDRQVMRVGVRRGAITIAAAV